MNPLPTSQQVMTWLCMCPADESTSRKKRLHYIGFAIFVGIVAFAALSGGVTYIIKHVSTDLANSLYATIGTFANAAVLNLIIFGLINRHRIASIFTELSELYTLNENENSFRYFAEANNRSEWLWKIYFKFGMNGTVANIVISSVGSIIYCFYKHGVFNVEFLYRPHAIILPWNQNTSYGYFGEITFSVVDSEVYMIVNGAVIILFISMCWHHHAFYQRFRYTALKLDQPGHKRNANVILRDLLQFHITAKDWFLQSAEVYSPLVLIQLICNVIFMASIVFQLDLRVKDIDFKFFILLNAGSFGVSNLFVYCYFGKMATESYEKMAECLYELNWNELSLDLQKKILIMIQNMQKPVYYHGFGVALLNLETFVTVIRTIYSYYMIFKTLTSE